MPRAVFRTHQGHGHDFLTLLKYLELVVVGVRFKCSGLTCRPVALAITSLLLPHISGE